MSRILVIYATTDGHTAKVAAAIARSLTGLGSTVDVIDARLAQDLGPAGYDAAIVAASVHAGRYQRPIYRWVRQHAAELNVMPTAFVSVSLAALDHSRAGELEVERTMVNFFAETWWVPTFQKGVAGALPYTRYNGLRRWMMRRIVSRKHGDTDTSRDYEYTDWKDLAHFTREFHDRPVVHTRIARAIA